MSPANPSSPTAIVEPAVLAPSPSPNPWADEESKPVIPPPLVNAEQIPSQELDLAPPNVFDDAILPPPTPSKGQVDTSLLNEFDPLSDTVEREAHDAWAQSEGHPPPPPAPPPKPITQPQPLLAFITKAANNAHLRRPSTNLEPPTSASANVTTFATLANLARSPFGARPARSSSMAQASFLPEEEDMPESPKVPPKDEVVANPVQPPVTLVKDSRQGDPTKADPPFDFQKFLDQMKSKSAEPVAKYLRSFLSNFVKRNFTVNDQIKLVRDFLDFITGKMRECDVWKNANDVDFENATEAMEKLVMNRLYDVTFSPQIDQTTHQVTTDDLERDHVLRQRMKLFGWIEEKHLDIPVGEGSQGFINFAEQELLKMNHYKAPRDKLICILNCCKVIFGLIRHLHSEEGADAFIPILIFVTLKANPEHLISNLEYINRFRSPSKLQSESGYYLSSLSGAVSFIETMDHTSLSNITQEEFESNVEAAIQALPDSPAPTDRNESLNRFPTPPALQLPRSTAPLGPASPHSGEEPAIPLKLPSTASIAEDTKRFFQRTGDSISKPLNAIGKILNEAMDGYDEIERQRQQTRARERETEEGAPGFLSQMGPDWLFGNSGAATPRPQTPSAAAIPVTPQGQAPYRPRIRPGSAGAGSDQGTPQTQDRSHRHSSYQIPALNLQPSPSPSTLSRSLPRDEYIQTPQPTPHRPSGLAPEYLGPIRPTTPLDLASLQGEIDRAHNAANQAARGTLLQMFPACEPDVIDMVMEANRGDLGQSIESLLEMMS